MKKKLSLASILVLFALYTNAQTSLRIVCMGNSITQGKIEGSNIKENSYRRWLWEKLDSAGVAIDMVGFHKFWFGENAGFMVTTPKSQYTAKTFDRDHDSYYGIKSDGLLNGDASSGWTGSALPKLSERLKSYTPDIALLHIGTNDADGDINKTVANIKAIIDELRLKNPKVIIFIAKLITGWKPINAKVDQIVADKSTVTSPVIAVDMYAGFINDPNAANTMTFDWVHPNERGQKFMANKWFNAIRKQVGLPTSISENLLDSQSPEVYPSVSSGIITLKNSEHAQVSVLNMTGKLVKTLEINDSAFLEFDMSALDNGLYIINIVQNNSLISKKVTIQR